MYREAIYSEISKNLKRQKSQSRELNLPELKKQQSKVKKSKGEESIGNKSTKATEVGFV